MSETVDERIAHLERIGYLAPGCGLCAEGYERVRAGALWPSGPKHRASSRCESGKYAHCACDTCF